MHRLLALVCLVPAAGAAVLPARPAIAAADAPAVATGAKDADGSDVGARGADQPVQVAWVEYRQNAPAQCPEFLAELGDYLTSAVEASIARPVKLQSITGYDVDDLVERTRNNQIDAAYLTPYMFVLTNQALGAGASLQARRYEAVASYMSNGESERFSKIVWTKGKYANVSAVLDALKADRGLKLALVNVNSTSGYLWPATWLLRHGIDVVRGGEITTIRAMTHDRALQFVRDRPDVIAAATFDEELMRWEARLASGSPSPFASITLTPALPLDAFAVRLDRPEIRDPLKNAFLKMHSDRVGQDLLVRCFEGALDRWVPAQNSYYQLVAAYAKVTTAPPTLSVKNCSELQTQLILAQLDGWFAQTPNSPDAKTTLDSWFTAESAPQGSGVPDIRCADAGQDVLKDPLFLTRLDELRRSHPLTGYLSEEAGTFTRDKGAEAQFGAQQGLAVGMTVALVRTTWVPPDEPGVAGAPERIRARIMSVDENVVRVLPVLPTRRMQLEKELNPNDRVFYSVEAEGYPKHADSPHMAIASDDAWFGSTGEMSISFTVSICDADGNPLPADEHGWLIEIKPGRGSKLLDDPPDRHLRLLQKGEWRTQDTVVLSRASLSSPVIARLFEHPSIAPARKAFGVWSGLSVWIWVLLSAVIGGVLRLVTLTLHSDKKLGEHGRGWWLRRVVEVASGLGAGVALFAGLTLLRTKPFDAVDPNSLLSRLMAGGLGGLVGASGIAALVHRLLAIKDPEA